MLLFFVFLSTLIKQSLCANKLNINGLVAAVMTPLDNNQEINYTIIPEQAKFLNSTGVNWVYVTGTTGESVSFTADERNQVLLEWLKIAAQYNIKVIYHVGANALPDARKMAKFAQDNGAIAIGAMPPNFFKPNNVNQLVKTMKVIANAAPELPMYYYHIPSMTGVTVSMYDFVKAAELEIPNLVGIKYTGLEQSWPSGSFPDALQVMNYKNGKYEVLTGRDELLVECLSMGVKGFVGSQYNFAGELYNNIINEFNNNNLINANKLQLSGVNLLEIEFNVTQGTDGVKLMNNIAGVNVGIPRLPYLEYTQNDINNMINNVKDWCNDNNNILSWCNNLN